MRAAVSICWLMALSSFATALAVAADLQDWDPPGISVFPDHDATVTGATPLGTFIAEGRQLFVTQLNIKDGAGRPTATGDSKPTLRARGENPVFQRLAGPDANSCAGCHNQPAIGGSGDFAANVFVGAHFTDPPTARIDAKITNERNTISVFGSGVIEMLAREMTDELQMQRKQAQLDAVATGRPVRVALSAKGIPFGHLVAKPGGTYDTAGVEGVDIDLIVKPFGVKGVAVSIREFTNFALNQHHGIQSVERFGWARTGVGDFDGDGVESEFSIGQVSALTVFQATLPAPIRQRPGNPGDLAVARLGEQRFREIGCAACHVPALPLRSLWFFEPNPYNRPGSAVPADVAGQIAAPFHVADDTGLYRDADGTLLVAPFTDLKRHVICDDEDRHFCNERIRQDFVPTDHFLTAKLWDAGSSAPYGHRGDLTTLSEAIVHHSGEATPARRNFLGLPNAEKVAIITFLRTLRVSDKPASHTWR